MSDRRSDAHSFPGGLDPRPLGSWLADRCGIAQPVTVQPVPGGRSNLTSIVVDADGRRVVVRRPPLSGVLASAHDVAREGRIMAALKSSRVPVPDVLAVDEEGEVLGVPVLVTGFVAGTVVRDRAAAELLSPSERALLSPAVVSTLAMLHDVDIDAVGLGDLARRDGYLARQVARWARQLERGSDREIPNLGELARVLATSVPEQESVSLVHGDYRLDNLIVDPGEAAVLAVLDWELATLGDPLADLATLVAYWGVPEVEGTRASVIHPDLPTAVAGFAGPRELVESYAVARALDGELLAERLRPFLAFAWFRIACILEGVRVRAASGAYGDPSGPAGAEVELLEGLVPELAARALGVAMGRGPLGFDHELT